MLQLHGGLSRIQYGYLRGIFKPSRLSFLEDFILNKNFSGTKVPPWRQGYHKIFVALHIIKNQEASNVVSKVQLLHINPWLCIKFLDCFRFLVLSSSYCHSFSDAWNWNWWYVCDYPVQKHFVSATQQSGLLYFYSFKYCRWHKDYELMINVKSYAIFIKAFGF